MSLSFLIIGVGCAVLIVVTAVAAYFIIRDREKE